MNPNQDLDSMRLKLNAAETQLASIHEQIVRTHTPGRKTLLMADYERCKFKVKNLKERVSKLEDVYNTNGLGDSHDFPDARILS